MHHWRRADDRYIVIVAKRVKRDFADVSRYHAGFKAWRLGGIQRIDRVEFLCLRPFFTLFIKQCAADILKTGDQIQRCDLIRVVIEIVQCGPDRCQSGTAADDQEMMIFSGECFFHRPPVSIRPAKEQCAALAQIKDTLRQTADFSDGKFHVAVTFAADRDRCFANLWNGEHAELTIVCWLIESHTEGELCLCLMRNA